jgi:hypothetical protein
VIGIVTVAILGIVVLIFICLRRLRKNGNTSEDDGNMEFDIEPFGEDDNGNQELISGFDQDWNDDVSWSPGVSDHQFE